MPLAAPGSQPHLPTHLKIGPTAIDFVVACPAPGGGLVFAWNDDALAPTKSIRVRWLLPDYTADPAEPAGGRLILPEGVGCELRGIHPDGVGGAFVAREQQGPGELYNEDVGEIWMTRLLPSAIAGAPPAGAPTTLMLRAPLPNPARDAVSLRMTLPDDSPATVALYDLAGRELRALELRGAGERTARFDDLGSLPPGLYLARVRHPRGEVHTRVVIAH